MPSVDRRLGIDQTALWSSQFWGQTPQQPQTRAQREILKELNSRGTTRLRRRAAEFLESPPRLPTAKQKLAALKLADEIQAVVSRVQEIARADVNSDYLGGLSNLDISDSAYAALHHKMDQARGSILAPFQDRLTELRAAADEVLKAGVPADAEEAIALARLLKISLSEDELAQLREGDAAHKAVAGAPSLEGKAELLWLSRAMGGLARRLEVVDLWRRSPIPASPSSRAIGMFAGEIARDLLERGRPVDLAEAIHLLGGQLTQPQRDDLESVRQFLADPATGGREIRSAAAHLRGSIVRLTSQLDRGAQDYPLWRGILEQVIHALGPSVTGDKGWQVHE